jgi:branched-chain amino acid transport system permease protein
MAVSETIPAPAAASDPAAFLRTRHRYRWWEALPWLLALLAVVVFPDRLTLGSQILLMVLFALSLDLILGYAGIATLGHAAYFGVGAYTAGLLAARAGWTEPISALAASAVVAGAVGYLSGLILLRYRGLTLLVLTFASTFILQELGNVFDHFTGGYDGLPGLAFQPLFGVFDYDLYGRTNYLYALAVLFVLFQLTRTLIYAPFGQSLVGIRENVARMNALGTPVYGRKLTVYALSAAMAGVAGALFTETNAYVTLGVFDFDYSAGVMVMLVLGGTGRLYGAFIGAVVYMLLQDQLSKASPAFWQFGIGLLLILTVLFAKRGLLGALEDIAAPLLRRYRP